MLSRQQCRRILGRGSTPPPDELDNLRRDMYKLANAAIEEFLRTRETPQEPTHTADPAALAHQTLGRGPDGSVLLYPDALRILPARRRERLQERAAIVEFEGGIERPDAERVALLDHLLFRSRDE